ncbi:MAG TPA: hypothetical protein VEU95_13915 [Micropepsaceae bacterium]|jgi:hypothetical protein|nr:hypothetical protein [Micropepsaceae bacterium]
MGETTLNLPIEKVLSACRAIRTRAYNEAKTYSEKNEFSKISKSEAFAAIFDALMPNAVQSLEAVCEAASVTGQTTIQVSAEDFQKIRPHYDR